METGHGFSLLRTTPWKPWTAISGTRNEQVRGSISRVGGRGCDRLTFWPNLIGRVTAMLHHNLAPAGHMMELSLGYPAKTTEGPTKLPLDALIRYLD